MDYELHIVLADEHASPMRLATLVDDNTLVVTLGDGQVPRGVVGPKLLADLARRDMTSFVSLDLAPPTVSEDLLVSGDTLYRYEFDVLTVECRASKITVTARGGGGDLRGGGPYPGDGGLAGDPVTPRIYYQCQRYLHDNWVAAYYMGMNCQVTTPMVHPL